MSCICSDPADFGLKVVGTVEDDRLSYEFDMFGVWQEKGMRDGILYYGQDSGCSCPCPFEDIKTIADLTPIRSKTGLQRFVTALSQWNRVEWNGGNKADISRLRTKVERAFERYSQKTGKAT